MLIIAQKKHDFDMTYIYAKKIQSKIITYEILEIISPGIMPASTTQDPELSPTAGKKVRDMSNLKILKSEGDSQTILPRASVWNAAIGFG